MVEPGLALAASDCEMIPIGRKEPGMLHWNVIYVDHPDLKMQKYQSYSALDLSHGVISKCNSVSVTRLWTTRFCYTFYQSPKQ